MSKCDFNVFETKVFEIKGVEHFLRIIDNSFSSISRHLKALTNLLIQLRFQLLIIFDILRYSLGQCFISWMRHLVLNTGHIDGNLIIFDMERQLGDSFVV